MRKAINRDWTPLLSWPSTMWPFVANELRSRGVNMEAKTDEGDTPLYLASFSGHLPVVKALLAVGADILFAANNYGQLASYPLHAVRNGNAAVSEIPETSRDTTFA
jgi:ankyrin repeat protein